MAFHVCRVYARQTGISVLKAVIGVNKEDITDKKYKLLRKKDLYLDGFKRIDWYGIVTTNGYIPMPKNAVYNLVA